MNQNKPGFVRYSNFGKVSGRSFLILSLLSIASIIIAMSIWLDSNCPSFYRLLPLLPIVHVVIIEVCLLLNRHLFERWETILTIAIYSVRNVLTPMVMRFGKYYGSFKQLTSANVNAGILLMLYETLIVFLFISTYKTGTKNSVGVRCKFSKESNIFTIILSGLILFCIAVYFLFPSTKEMYISIFSSKGLRTSLLSNTSFESGTTNRGISTMFQVLLPVTYMLGCIGLMKFVHQKVNKYKVIVVIANILIVMVPLFFMDGSDGNSIISIATLFLVSMFVNSEKKGSILRIGVIGCIAVALYVFAEAMTAVFIYKKVSFGENMSNMFQSYFPGVCNMAGVFNVKDYGRLSQLGYDLYSTIPFRNTLFGLTGFETTPNLYTIDNNALSHIMPCVGHAYYYIGILAPVIPCIIFKTAFDRYRKIVETTDPFRYGAYVYFFLYLILTPIMYNSLILLRHYFATFLPMLLLVHLNGREPKAQTNLRGEV